jgi:hypothetical protein
MFSFAMVVVTVAIALHASADFRAAVLLLRMQNPQDAGALARLTAGFR